MCTSTRKACGHVTDVPGSSHSPGSEFPLLCNGVYCLLHQGALSTKMAMARVALEQGGEWGRGELCLGKGRPSSTLKQHSGGSSCRQVSSTGDMNTKFSYSCCEFLSLAVLQWAEDTGGSVLSCLWLTIFLPLPSDSPLASGKECDTGVPALAEHSRDPFSTLRLGSGVLQV